MRLGCQRGIHPRVIASVCLFLVLHSLYGQETHAPVVCESHTPSACSPALQPVFAKHREPLRAWSG